jgi:DNA-binding NtrC family response regulator
VTDPKATVLIVDDEQNHADGIVESLEKLPVKATAVYSGDDALQILRSQPIDVVVTDLKLGSEADGLDVLDEAKKQNPYAEVILITAYATINTCKDAMRRGAYDYLVKPIDIDQLRTLVAQGAKKALVAQAQQTIEVAPENADGFSFAGILGKSPAMEQVIEVARRVAPTDISVLIEGPSGTGKELLAQAIHDNSSRRFKPFVPVNCAGLTESLLESELFGHAKGAFTGAATDRKGLFEVANEGTLFLDEIGDMPLNMQAKLLRVLEGGLIVPVGTSKPIVVDVRIISATNQNFQRLIEDKAFREDLYFRIKGVNISLPAVRERAEDIPELTQYFIREASQEIGSQVTAISEAAQTILAAYEWPGNIRQLRNCLRSMVVMCDETTLDVRDIPPDIAQRPRLEGETASGAPNSLAGLSLSELEKQAIADTLAKTEGNREKAAKILGIGERTLYRKIKEYEI